MTTQELAPATEIARLEDGASLDVLVLGGGGAGLSAAVYAAAAGLKVALLERTEVVGGTTAFTAGTTWVPGNPLLEELGIEDSLDDATEFLDHSVGERSPKALRDAFLRLAGDAVTAMQDNSAVRYRPRGMHPDYLTELPGSRLGGRAIEPRPFDARALGERAALVRPPLPEFTAFGGMMLERDDIAHLLGRFDRAESRAHLLALRRRYRDDLREYGRDTRMTMGNGLIAALLWTLDSRGVPVEVGSSATALVREPDGSLRVRIQGPNGEYEVTTKNVVLASGGFNRHPQRRADYLPGHDIAWCPGAPGHTGEAHDLADKLGAVYGTRGLAHAFFAPVSRRVRPDGSVAVFPHFLMDRAKPRMLVVDQHGRRYLNEATSYHLFGIEMVTHAQGNYAAIPSYLVTDAEGLRRYGLGVVHPFGNARRLQPYLDEGYLVCGETLADLALELGLDAELFERTVARNNALAATGVDDDHAKGTTDYQRFNGDPAADSANPNLGPIEQGPFYAVRLYPGDIGAATGYVTDEAAAALDRDGERIPGLYAVGNDMQSMVGGTYPAPGITLGPGLVFAYAAICDIAGRSLVR